MEEIRKYLLRIVVSAIVCGIAAGLTEKSGTTGKLVKMITGVFMLLTVVSPVFQFRIGSLGSYFDNISIQADAFVTEGKKVSAEALADIIKARTEAYILDKADSFGATLAVEVGLTDEQIPKPSTVRVSGSISPYGKRQLQSIIWEELGIALEDQIWTG